MHDDLALRAARHAALGDAVRLALIGELQASDRSPLELRRLVGVESNLLAHHLDVLERVGLVRRTRSNGDGRRRYVHLIRHALDALAATPRPRPERAVFVCTHNSARSQLAAALWTELTSGPAQSGGTRPAAQVHPHAVAAARRAGLDLGAARPRSIDEIDLTSAVVVTVCDQAHEELGADDSWLHWSIADPVADGRRAAFDATVTELRSRIGALVEVAA